jgi:hypothetical protein
MEKKLINIRRILYSLNDEVTVNNVDKLLLTAIVGYNIANYWTELYLTPGTLVYEEENDEDANGPVSRQKFSGSAPGNTLRDNHDINFLQRNDFYVRLDGVDGNSYVVGISGDAIQFKFTTNTENGATIVSFEHEDDCPVLRLI